VSTKPSRFGTRSLETASRRCVNWKPRLRVPNLDGVVPATAGNLPSRGGGCVPMPGQRRLANRTFYISIFSAYIYRKRLRFRVACLMDTPRNMIFLFFCCSMLIKKNLPIRVPGQRRLAISRLRVPNLDGSVIAAAGNLFSIRAPRHRVDPEKRGQDTN